MAEPLDGPVCRELAAIARRHRIALVPGVVDTSEEPVRAYSLQEFPVVAFGVGQRLGRERPCRLMPGLAVGRVSGLHLACVSTGVRFLHGSPLTVM
ncbi:hypothetical protein A6A22_05970 [Arthrobacter sp. OY3WO11]|nr:hypothetical protein A6A22_05970 [Arthrobacter sp. OY3WO11]